MPRPFRRVVPCLTAALFPAAGLAAETLAELHHRFGQTGVTLTFADTGPIRLIPLDDPPRLLVDLPGPAPRVIGRPDGLLAGARSGLAAEDRGRLALDLTGPVQVASAELSRLPDGRARLRLRLSPDAGPPQARTLPPEALPPRAPDPREPADPRPVVMIDPGHGGADPGAVRGDLVEKHLVLDFARDLAAALEAGGRWRPALTREDDRTLGLRERVALAEAAGAAALLSLHANTVERGDAFGATVYTLSDTATDPVGAALAAVENRADVTALAETAGADDVAAMLLDLTRPATQAASGRLGEGLARGLAAVTPMLRDREHEQARFLVLTSARTASALIELGFLSNADDAARLTDPAWRAEAAAALARALDAWAETPEAQAALRLDPVTSGR